MKRRRFLHQAGIGTLALGWSARAFAMPADGPAVSLTFDDPRVDQPGLLAPGERNEKLLGTFRKNNLRTALFVCGTRVDSEAGMRLVEKWGAEGHIVANHSYSHLYYHSPQISAEQYIQDVLRGEKQIRGLPGFRKLFRFPFLKEGETTEKRDAVRSFLAEHEYRNGYVTIVSSDWYIDSRLRERLKTDPDANLTPYRNFYLEHIWERASYYHELALKVAGRPVKHTLVLHHNLLNALFLPDLIKMFQEKLWRVIDAAEAFDDPIFAAAPEIVPAGESLIWALAKETGRFDDSLRYPGEDGVYEKDRMDALGL